MTKIKIVSNPYNRTLAYFIYKEQADTWKTSNRTVSTAVSARTIAIQPDTVEDLGVNGIGNGLFRKYDIMI